MFSLYKLLKVENIINYNVLYCTNSILPFENTILTPIDYIIFLVQNY